MNTTTKNTMIFMSGLALSTTFLLVLTNAIWAVLASCVVMGIGYIIYINKEMLRFNHRNSTTPKNIDVNTLLLIEDRACDVELQVWLYNTSVLPPVDMFLTCTNLSVEMRIKLTIYFEKLSMYKRLPKDFASRQILSKFNGSHELLFFLTKQLGIHSPYRVVADQQFLSSY